MRNITAIYITGESYALTAGDLDDRYRRYLSYHGYKAGSMLYIRVMVNAGSIPATLTN